MKIRKVFAILIVLSLCTSLVGCAGKEYTSYANAVKEQNVTLQLMADKESAKREAAQLKHEEKMLLLTSNALQAVAATPDKTDDVITPLMLMVLEDKWLTTRALADATTPKVTLGKIEAPETVGESVQKMGGTLLGLAGVALGITQSNNAKDIAVAGINGAGTHNTATDSHITSGDGSQTTNSITETIPATDPGVIE